jgi:hypothetical protein
MDGNRLTWVDDVTETSAANFNRLEALVQDAVDDSKGQMAAADLPAPSAANRNWIVVDSYGQTWFQNGYGWVPMGQQGNFEPVRVATSKNSALAFGNSRPQIDGVILDDGDRVALAGQTTTAQNGIYELRYQLGIFSLARPDDANHARHFRRGQHIYVRDGSYKGQQIVVALTPATISADPLTFYLPPKMVDRTSMIGQVVAWTRRVVPSGLVLADGQRLNQSAYPDAYDIAKAEADAGNAEWTYRTSDFTFTVPNLTDRFIYAASSLAQVGGSGNRGGTTEHRHNFGFALGDYNWGARGGAAGMGEVGHGGAYSYAEGRFKGGSSNGGWGSNASGEGVGGVNVTRVQSFGDTDLQSTLPPFVRLAQLIRVA